jgi:son of sevenless-like protein
MADTAFFQAFLLTFRSFTTGSELVELLFDRYMLEPPDSLDERQYAEWKKMKQTPIRLRWVRRGLRYQRGDKRE